ncbi:nuclear transport factor 2 family protein [Sphingobium sufflavum]|uniref:nuclear transport factor 2 family protein n=1 Tax=Sphingobium sufflavum TaxID=1129547 RepID=UPI001F236D07|nr:nuclear transport factor 2 family protein [Sphingobium sufflavum]MCE7795080.1 nuclear transport factor 2 family protein [Sphingobium sufflavum]
MTQNPSHRIARDFFAALSNGALPLEMLTDDMTAWTTTSGVQSARERYAGGIQMFATLFPNGLLYTVESLTAEEDRVVAEVQADGLLSNGDIFQNRYVFVLRLREGRIAAVAEHFNPDPVRNQIVPLLQHVMAKNAG